MDQQAARQGLMYGVISYGLWGLIPLYFKSVMHVPPLQVVAHRIVWSFALLAGIITLLRRWADVRSVLAAPATRFTLVATTALIAVNWLTYIYAVSTGQVLQSSLGYFVTPLVNVALGVVVLHERLRTWQIVAIGLALLGVLNLTLTGSEFPWIAITLALSFSVYGLLRKTVAAESLVALLVETMLVAPLSLAYIVYVQSTSTEAANAVDGRTLLLLVLSGPITAAPLLAFAAAARRLRYSTLGVLQYMAPTIQFLLAVTVFGEPISRSMLLSFACIWLAILVYTVDSLRAYRNHLATRETTPEATLTPAAAARGDYVDEDPSRLGSRPAITLLEPPEVI